MRPFGVILTALILGQAVPGVAEVRTPDLRTDEVGFGQAWLRNTRGQLNERVDPFCTDLLETWLSRLRNHVSIGTLPLTGLCLNSAGFNAFAAPGGIVAINRGVYAALSTEGEVMAVLAHELSHLSLRHHLRGVRQQEGLSPARLALLAGLVAAIATEQGGQAAQSLIMGGQAAELQNQLAYSRDFEREADRVGLDALVGAGYRPEAMVAVLRYLAEQQARGRTDLSFLSTHPLGIERQSDLEARIQGLEGGGRDEAILSADGYALYRCMQLEGLEGPLVGARHDCAAIWEILQAYRDKQPDRALSLWMTQSDGLRSTLPGLDLTLAIQLARRDRPAVEGALDEIALLYPAWVMIAIAQLEMASWDGISEVPRTVRAVLTDRPDRLDAWRALGRFAQSTGQAHLLHEARAWDLMLHGQIKAARDQLAEMTKTWPQSLDRRPIERLRTTLEALPKS